MRAGKTAIPLNPASPLAALLAAPVQPGVVRWIGLRPGRRQPMTTAAEATLEPGRGVLGDRWQGATTGGRQVTLVAAEHLVAIAHYLGRSLVTPEQLRRNIVVGGINLLALKGHKVRLGSAILEITGECHPCSRMEETFGPGGYNAVRGHGGVTARVLSSGIVAVGGAFARLD